MNFIFRHLADNTNPLSVSFNMRIKRFNIFKELLHITPMTKILDVGGSVSTWIGTGFEENVTLLNLAFSSKQLPFKYIEGDGCDMNMIRDQEFDVVFSNSVIEHVGQYPRQKLFAKEIVRVGKKYWVQTPNKYFPIEPHFVFPLFQFLPRRIKIFVGINYKGSHFKREGYTNSEIIREIDMIRLLTKNEMFNLFGDPILQEKYWSMTKSFIAIKK